MAVCPFCCGLCCKHDQWTFIFKEAILERGLKLREQTGWRGTIDEAWENERCLFLGKQGCTLPREERPSICLHYLCTRACAKLRERKKESCQSRSASAATILRASTPPRA